MSKVTSHTAIAPTSSVLHSALRQLSGQSVAQIAAPLRRWRVEEPSALLKRVTMLCHYLARKDLELSTARELLDICGGFATVLSMLDSPDATIHTSGASLAESLTDDNVMIEPRLEFVAAGGVETCLKWLGCLVNNISDEDPRISGALGAQRILAFTLRSGDAPQRFLDADGLHIITRSLDTFAGSVAAVQSAFVVLTSVAGSSPSAAAAVAAPELRLAGAAIDALHRHGVAIVSALGLVVTLSGNGLDVLSPADCVLAIRVITAVLEEHADTLPALVAGLCCQVLCITSILRAHLSGVVITDVLAIDATRTLVGALQHHQLDAVVAVQCCAAYPALTQRPVGSC